ncbi:MAG: hypothetical protein ACYSWQ_08515 [Planctomycetota bacterium]|jgi:hypothetical protein
MTLGRIVLTCIKLFLMIVVTMYFKFLIPELRYDFGPKEPVKIESLEQLAAARSPRAVFASVRGKADFTKAVVLAKHGVRYTYFLLEEYGPMLVVRTPEEVSEQWTDIEFHVGRLRHYKRMPFDRTVSAGFRTRRDITIPEDAFFLGRDDAPRPGGWSVGALIFSSVLWCVLFYFFFVHGRIVAVRKGRSENALPSSEGQ